MTELTKEQQEKNRKAFIKALDKMKPEKAMPAKMRKGFKKQGWEFKDWCMTKRYKEYFIYMEFDMGDICVYPGSKVNGWLLEKKKSCKNIIEAIVATIELENRIDAGEHWVGEND